MPIWTSSPGPMTASASHGLNCAWTAVGVGLVVHRVQQRLDPDGAASLVTGPTPVSPVRSAKNSFHAACLPGVYLQVQDLALPVAVDAHDDHHDGVGHRQTLGPSSRRNDRGPRNSSDAGVARTTRSEGRRRDLPFDMPEAGQASSCCQRIRPGRWPHPSAGSAAR